MAIDKTGPWWIGSEPADIEEYRGAYTDSPDSYHSTTFRSVKCECRLDRFELQRALSVTKRTCPGCGKCGFICAQLDDWEEAEEEGSEPYQCVECGSKVANVGVGFAGYEELPPIDAVKWLFVGVRCAQCGILGCFNDSKVARGPANDVYADV